ncbi:MAG TPA: hypothetical protein VML50_12420 [Anaeromyxobacter sp.]|nr:hypothetical protein [Anaeromyxobacter sp.]
MPVRPILAATLLAALLAIPVRAADAPHPGADAILLTIFLRHDQSRPLGELEAQLDKNGWFTSFPPAGTEVVSWYVMMGIGQVVTLRVPPGQLRAVNLAVERGAWGAYRTEFYPTYDYQKLWEEQRARHQKP